MADLGNVLVNMMNDSDGGDSSLTFEVDHLELLKIFYGNLSDVS